MTIEEFIVDFADLFPDLSADEVRSDTELADLPQWDSLGVLLVISYADDKAGRTLTGAELQKCMTIKAMYQLIFGER